MSILSQSYFYNESAAFKHLESIVWPNGAVCPHCGGKDRIYELKGKSTRVGLKKCSHCRKQFTVKVGTVFESSHIPLHKWLQATYLIASGKENISIHKLHQVLEITYKTAWQMNQKLSSAMKNFNSPSYPGVLMVTPEMLEAWEAKHSRIVENIKEQEAYRKDLEIAIEVIKDLLSNNR